MDNFTILTKNREVMKQNFKNLKSENDILADMWYIVDYGGEV